METAREGTGCIIANVSPCHGRHADISLPEEPRGCLSRQPLVFVDPSFQLADVHFGVRVTAIEALEFKRRSTICLERNASLSQPSSARRAIGELDLWMGIFTLSLIMSVTP
jgi:hypothetical protein